VSNKSRPPLIGEGLVTRALRVEVGDVARVKAYLEVHEGLAAIFGERGGEIVIASPRDREAELDAVLSEMPIFLARFH
jgi:hypothetical protein